ncbi:MAG: leucine-rich repeat domain-containing protein [Candidatus Thorarchaeota archaeon]
MTEITIKYWGHQGRQEERKFQCDDRKIDMVMRTAQRVDLSELTKCTELEVLNLTNNMIEEIDLSPLASSKLLTTLQLENNHLTSLDLWSLARSKSLTNLDLKNNRLPGLDLTPLFLRAHIELDSFVVISADYILRYGLTSDQLEKRFLLVRPDKAPWTATPVIIWNKYETLAKKMEWSDIHQRISTILDQVDERDWFAIQRGLLMGLSLEEIAGYDGDPRDLLSTTTDDMDFTTARNAVFDRAIELLDSQVEVGGSTLFLDTESMKITRASKLIPKIIEARRLEMENAIVQTKGSVALMNSLWFTHYGFKILQALDVGMQHYGDGLGRMKESLEELGFELKTEEVASIATTQTIYPINASDSLKKYVSHLIEKAYSK